MANLTTYQELIDWYIQLSAKEQLEPIAQGILDAHNELIVLKSSHEKLLDNLQRAIDAIDVLAPSKFIGLVNIRNNRLYNHRRAKQALSAAEKIKESKE